jgi:hypothetical protein
MKQKHPARIASDANFPVLSYNIFLCPLDHGTGDQTTPSNLKAH